MKTSFKQLSPQQKLKRILLWLVLPMVVFFGGGGYLAHHSGFVINYSGSMPYGLYKAKKVSSEKLKKGMDVLVCLPDQAINEGFKQGYLHKDKRCANGAEPLIKKIIAVNGDVVIASDNTIVVTSHDVSQRYFAPMQTNSLSGKRVKSWLKKKTFLLKNHVWVYGAYHSDYSWDSRYFGPIQNDYVLAQLVPVWVSH